MNERFDVIVTILELIGTAAFAASGALTAIKRRFDLFGVIIIGVTTAVGGGIMRDIVIGSHPVAAFRDPLAMSAAAAERRLLSPLSGRFSICRRMIFMNMALK